MEPLAGAGGTRCALLPDGTFRIFTRYLPIQSVQSVKYSLDGVNWNTLSWTPLIDGRQSFRLLPPISGQDLITNLWGWPNYGWLQFTYLNGYVNGSLKQAQLANDTSIQVDDPTGVAAGMTLTLYAGVNQESVVVASSYVSGSNTVPLTAGLVYGHSAGERVSNAPTNLREAAIMVSAELVRQRGYEAVTIMPTGQGRVKTAQMAAATNPLGAAEEMIRPFRRIV